MPTTIDREAWPAAAVGAVPALVAAVFGKPRTAAALALLPVGARVNLDTLPIGDTNQTGTACFSMTSKRMRETS